MPQHQVDLPQSARDHMSATAAQKLPETIAPAGDLGVYVENGAYGSGWYHYGTSADQVFIDHQGVPDFYIMDFGVTSDGGFKPTGMDTVDQYSGAFDAVIYENGDAPPYHVGAPSSWTGAPGQTGSSLRINFQLVDQDSHVVGQIGSFNIDYWVG